jgi:hypothetical protein
MLDGAMWRGHTPAAMAWIKPARIAVQLLAVVNVTLLAIDWPHVGTLNRVFLLIVSAAAIAITYVEHPEHLGLPGRPRKRVILGAVVVLVGGIAWLAAGAPPR